ncbi:g13014 [Coccomyxa viridis]|uniref:G13014 protein n=1 Tax=Coccomyxa viridis TaxID=1274662 RepID=A0ABP1GBV7_9CHLO
MPAATLSPQMNIEPAEIDWGIAELDLSLSSGMADPTIFNLLHTLTGGGDGGDVQDEGPVPSSYPASGVSFPQATVPFCTQADAPFSSPNLADHGIDPLLPHSDTLTHEEQIGNLARMDQARRAQQLMETPFDMPRQQLQAPSFPQQMGFARRHPAQYTPEARVRPRTAMAAPGYTGELSPGMHMPVIPVERPTKMQRTTSCPSNGYYYPPPMHMANGASPQEGQSWQHMTPGRAPEPERHYRGRDVTRFAGWAAQTQSEDDPGSPPRRKGKGGRQRAPAPDASVDPKRAKRIMANRASAAKSKEKQKQKVQELEAQKKAKQEEIKALELANSGREEDCKALQDQLTKLNDLEQDYHRLQGLNRKLTEFHSVLQKALKDSQGLSCYGISSQPNCLPQNAYSGAPVSVHAFNSITMPGGLPAHKGAQFDPDTPELDIPPFHELSGSFEQANCMGSTSPPDLHEGSGH